MAVAIRAEPAANQANHHHQEQVPPVAEMVAIPIAEKIPNDEDSVGADNEFARILAIKGKILIFREIPENTFHKLIRWFWYFCNLQP